MVGTGLGAEDVVGLAGAVAALAEALGVWQCRDDSRAQPQSREAGGSALRSIDRALGELHRLRQMLVGELRVSDDAADRRADALIASLRERDR